MHDRYRAKVRALFKRAFDAELHAGFEEAFDTRDPRLSLVVLDKKASVRAFVIARENNDTQWRSIRVDKAVEVCYLAVAVRAQGCGLGRRLLEACRAKAAQRYKSYSSWSMWLMVSNELTHAVRLYGQIGFEPWRKVVSDQPGWLMGWHTHPYALRSSRAI
jgi:ribosomal protein S18 acetylase RimI-like enzyme